MGSRMEYNVSMEYCGECDRMIDLDIDSEHEHFEETKEDET